jgi:hypothetical protein
MNRRDFLYLCGVSALPVRARAQHADRATPAWRTFDVTTEVDVLNSAGVTRVWVPAALIIETPYQRTLNTSFASAAPARLVEERTDALGTVAAVFEKDAKPALRVTSRVMTRDYGSIQVHNHLARSRLTDVQGARCKVQRASAKCKVRRARQDELHRARARCTRTLHLALARCTLH